MKAYKFKVTSPEQSERLQKVLFNLGYEWHCGYMIQFTDYPYLYVDNGIDDEITYGDSEEEFDTSDYKLKDTDKFIKKHSKRFVKKDKWISVDDGEITANTLFIVYCDDDNKMHVASYRPDAAPWCQTPGAWSDNNDSDCYLSNVTHYRKLPKGPK